MQPGVAGRRGRWPGGVVITEHVGGGCRDRAANIASGEASLVDVVHEGG